MPNYPVLPQLYGFAITKKPVFQSIVQSFRSGRVVRNAEQDFPLWEFDLKYESLKDETQNDTIYRPNTGYTDYTTLASYFTFCNGQYGRFLYEDLTDCSRTLQVLGTGNGVQTGFIFIATITDGALFVTQPIGQVNQAHTVTIYKNGVPVSQAGNWELNEDGTKVTFTAPVANGVVVSADFYFYYLCRFISDEQDFEQFYKNHWMATLKFRSVLKYAEQVGNYPDWVPYGVPPDPVPGEQSWHIFRLLSPDADVAYSRNDVFPGSCSRLGDFALGNLQDPDTGLNVPVQWNLNTFEGFAFPILVETIHDYWAVAIAGNGSFDDGDTFAAFDKTTSGTPDIAIYTDDTGTHLLESGPGGTPLGIGAQSLGISADRDYIVGKVTTIAFTRTVAAYWADVSADANYTLLALLSGSNVSEARGIDDGKAIICGNDFDTGTSKVVAVKWHGLAFGTETVLDRPLGTERTVAMGISADGTIIVGSTDDGTDLTATWWSDVTHHALPFLNDAHRVAEANGINADDNNVICGGSFNAFDVYNPVVWRNGVLEVLPKFPSSGNGAAGEGIAVSADGNTVFGYMEDPATDDIAMAVWKYF